MTAAECSSLLKTFWTQDFRKSDNLVRVSQLLVYSCVILGPGSLGVASSEAPHSPHTQAAKAALARPSFNLNCSVEVAFFVAEITHHPWLSHLA